MHKWKILKKLIKCFKYVELDATAVLNTIQWKFFMFFCFDFQIQTIVVPIQKFIKNENDRIGENEWRKSTLDMTFAMSPILHPRIDKTIKNLERLIYAEIKRNGAFNTKKPKIV